MIVEIVEGVVDAVHKSMIFRKYQKHRNVKVYREAVIVGISWGADTAHKSLSRDNSPHTFTLFHPRNEEKYQESQYHKIDQN